MRIRASISRAKLPVDTPPRRLQPQSQIARHPSSEENEQPEYIIRGTPGGIQYIGELEDQCYWGNEVKVYERHVDALFAMFWHKEPDIKYYLCTINKTFAKPGQHMVHYTEENLLDYIDPNNHTFMVRLANGRLRAEYRITVGTDKMATITINWSEFRRRANIREGDICAFHFRVISKCLLNLIVHRL
ncbi:hypothetical protein ACQJBY_041309 [Aegilops geniculata]